MEIVRVNDQEAAKLLFERYNIPYSITSRGEDKGELRVKPLRERDKNRLWTFQQDLRAKHPDIVDHCMTFRDEEDNLIVTFSPYGCYKPGKYELDDLDIDILEFSIYGY